LSARTDATARVTALTAAWFWRQRRSRALATEVGLCPVRGLVAPAQGRWRVDLAAVTVEDSAEGVHVVEVKGTAEDLAREDLALGKWQLDYAAYQLHPWLAVDVSMKASPPRGWGLLVVGENVVVAKKPTDVTTDYHQPNDHVTRAYRAIAEVVTAQRLPTLMGLSGHGTAAAMLQSGFHLPWLDWMSKSRDQELSGYPDEDAKVL